MAEYTFVGSANFTKHELQNFRVQNLSSAPSSPSIGQEYFDTALGYLRVWDGSAWQRASGNTGSTNLDWNPSTSTVTSDTGTDATLTLVDGTNPGLMSVAMKTKLDGIETGAEVNDTASEILTKLLTVDGSGSNLDADLLDGQSGAYYLARANHTGTQTASTISDFDTQVRTSRLDQMATPTGSVSMGSQKITDLADPSAGSDAANKNYVDNKLDGLSWKASVRVATTTAGTLASSFESGDTVDGVVLATDDRILIKDQSTGSENGIYKVNASGAPTRASDANTAAELVNATVFVQEGSVNADSAWTCTTNAPITLETTALSFAQKDAGAIPDASETVKGKVELATLAETEAKSSSTLAVTPAGLANFGRSATFTITGDGSTTQFTVTHNFGTRDVSLYMRDLSDDTFVFPPTPEAPSTNTARVTFGTAPSNGKQYRIKVDAL